MRKGYCAMNGHRWAALGCWAARAQGSRLLWPPLLGPPPMISAMTIISRLTPTRLSVCAALCAATHSIHPTI